MHGERADDDFVLTKTSLEREAVVLPPAFVQTVDHHFVNDDVITLGSSSLVCPQPARRGSGIRGQAPEALRKLARHLVEKLACKRRVIPVAERQQDLNQVLAGQ